MQSKVCFVLSCLFSTYLSSVVCQAIKRIEQQIRGLESEKRLGKREIDDIDHDIRCKRQEISDLRRKYLNYFYYF